ncbi:hypothetical protein, partial [Limosilactobacillus reuteri]|uniref:hypothetical protein n=1 Tax=Limosilactobacillus reuteri TaxID=1598 RepID=UPI002AFE37F6
MNVLITSCDLKGRGDKTKKQRGEEKGRSCSVKISVLTMEKNGETCGGIILWSTKKKKKKKK